MTTAAVRRLQQLIHGAGIGIGREESIHGECTGSTMHTVILRFDFPNEPRVVISYTRPLRAPAFLPARGIGCILYGQHLAIST